jgi:REP element-mobilizing transposase RayT
VHSSILGWSVSGYLSYNQAMHKHLRRLDRIWLDSPIYFITMCTKDRRAVLARDKVTEILIEEWRAARERHGRVVGRYVIMPDQVHFFCRRELGATKLSQFSGAWKSWTSRKIHVGWAAVSDRGYSAVATRILRSRSSLRRELQREMELRFR